MSSLTDTIQSAEGKISGASLVPVYQYPLDGYATSLRGKTCVFLGREKSNRYRGKLNFFGGRVGRKDAENPMHALIREVAEELGLKLTPDTIESCLLHSRLVQQEETMYFTLLVFVHITGLRRSFWDSIMQKRQRQHAPANQREMTEVCHVALEDLSTRTDLSSYVQQYASLIKDVGDLLSPGNHVSFSSLETVVRPDQIDLFH